MLFLLSENIVIFNKFSKFLNNLINTSGIKQLPSIFIFLNCFQCTIHFRIVNRKTLSKDVIGIIFLSRKYFVSSNIIYPLKCKFWDFQVLGQNLPNSSRHISKHKSLRPRILHQSSVLWHITSLYFFGSNIMYFRQRWHIKVLIFRLSTACIKINQIPHAIFGTKSLFFSLFASLFSVMRHNSSMLFRLKLYTVWTKGVHQRANFRLFTACMKINTNSWFHLSSHMLIFL